MEYRAMSDGELKEVIRQAQAELGSRVAVRDLVLYTHDCKESSKYHLKKYKHWAKHVKAVDESKTNGYAFDGDFLAVYAEHKLPVGALVVEVCDSDIELYRMGAEGKEQLAKASTRSMSGLIEQAAAELSK